MARNTFGYSKREMLTQDIGTLLKPKVNERWERIVDSIQSKSYWKGELLAVSKDGREFPVDMAVNTSGSDRNEVTKIICFMRDVSKEKEVDRMKSEFISMVSHELRTPITSIKNAVGIVLGKAAGTINENQRKFLSMANRNIDRLSGIINDLLDVSKIESGIIKIDLKPFNLRAPLDMAIASLTSGFKEKSIPIHKEIPYDLPHAYGDSDKLEQIFINLLDNAIKFTSEGGEICVTADLISEFGPQFSELKEEEKQSVIEVSIADTGIGISPDKLEKLFDRFYQVEESLTREQKGTGLGLYIVKGLVEALGGDIWVESELGKGSKFIFTLPIYSPEKELKDYLDREIAVAQEKGAPLSLIMLKIEEFNYLSETYGKKNTLKLINEVKHLIKDTARRTTDLIKIQTTGRVMMILLDTPKNGAIALDDRLKGVLSKQKFKINNSLKINLISRIVTYPDNGTTADELITKAEGLA